MKLILLLCIGFSLNIMYAQSDVELEIRLQGCCLFINGEEISQNKTLDNLMDVIGPYNREYDRRPVYTWDSIGVYAYTPRTSDTITQVNISMFDGNAPGNNKKYPLPFSTKKRFENGLLIGNKILYPDATKEEIEAIGFKRDRYLYTMHYGCFKLVLNYFNEEFGDLMIDNLKY